MASKARDFAVVFEERVVPPGATRFGIVIAIEKYRDSRHNLGCVRKDGEAMYRLMTDPGIGLFRKENVTLLVDADATCERIRRSLASLQKKVAPTDTVWIYYAGHGAPDGNETYWVPHDAEVDDLCSTGLSATDLANLLDSIKAERLVTFLDCCHAAATTAGKNRTRQIPVSADEAIKAFKGKGRITFCSSDHNEKSVELTDVGHGAFTYFLTRGLAGEADECGAGVVTTESLWKYLRGKVTDASRNAGRLQTPIKRGEESHDFPLTVNPAVSEDRQKLAEWIRTYTGLGPAVLRTEEGEFCVKLLSRPIWGQEDQARVQSIRRLIAGELTIADFRDMLRGDMARREKAGEGAPSWNKPEPAITSAPVTTPPAAPPEPGHRRMGSVWLFAALAACCALVVAVVLSAAAARHFNAMFVTGTGGTLPAATPLAIAAPPPPDVRKLTINATLASHIEPRASTITPTTRPEQTVVPPPPIAIVVKPPAIPPTPVTPPVATEVIELVAVAEHDHTGAETKAIAELDQALRMVPDENLVGKDWVRLHRRQITGLEILCGPLDMELVKLPGTKTFMGRYPVSLRQYRKFVAKKQWPEVPSYYIWSPKNTAMAPGQGVSWKTPEFYKTDSDPVVCVTKDDAEGFCSYVTDLDAKHRYTLASRENWASADDGLTRTDAEIPNNRGVYAMGGPVRQWGSDVVLGSSWAASNLKWPGLTNPGQLRHDRGYSDVGIRCVMTEN